MRLRPTGRGRHLSSWTLRGASRRQAQEGQCDISFYFVCKIKYIVLIPPWAESYLPFYIFCHTSFLFLIGDIWLGENKPV